VIPTEQPPDIPFQGVAPLPVPYENPWGLLARDGRAVVASLRLQARELWRRNRQGDLRRPGFWPADLAPLFWPLALALAGGLLALLVVGGAKLFAPGPDGVGPPAGVAPAAEVRPATLESETLASPTLNPEALEPEPLNPELLEVAAAEPIAAEPLAVEKSLAVESPAAESLPAENPGPDPLEAAMGEVDPGHWIRAIAADPERGTLQLVLAAPFTALPEAQQLQQAETWQTQAQALGFDRLELTDRQGRPIGRQARVGSGMILLTPQHLS
jgi:hypothetical protein